MLSVGKAHMRKILSVGKMANCMAMEGVLDLSNRAISEKNTDLSCPLST